MGVQRNTRWGYREILNEGTEKYSKPKNDKNMQRKCLYGESNRAKYSRMDQVKFAEDSL